MTKQKNDLAYFTESVNRLMEGELILVDKNIALLLKCVADTPALRNCLSDAIKQSSYVTEFSRAKVTLTRADGVTENRLKLPSERDRLFAFVVCLLTEVDSGRRNFVDFLREYYGDVDSSAEYRRFCHEVLKPFKKAGEGILKSVDPDSLDADFRERAEKFFAAESIYINSADLRKMLSLTQSVRQLVNSEFVTEEGRAEALAICDAFTNALHLKNPKILHFVWIGFKNTLLPRTSMTEYVTQIAKVLSKTL